jgi:hypothetical protein
LQSTGIKISKVACTSFKHMFIRVEKGITGEHRPDFPNIHCTAVSSKKKQSSNYSISARYVPDVI